VNTKSLDSLRISIVTPSFNQGQFLEKTILSVLDQDYPNLEYIIMDGGSTDGSVEIIQKYASRLAYWVSQRDRGQSDAINRGFQRSTGDILAYINSDDYYLPGVFSIISDYFSQHPEVDIVFGDLHVIDPAGNLLGIKKAVPYDYWSAVFAGSVVPQPATFFRRRVFDRVGYLDEDLKYNMDIEFFARCGKSKLRFGTIPTPLACFRLHPASKTMDSGKIKEANLRMIERYYRFPPQFGGLKRSALLFLRFIFRLRMYLARAILRGEWIPYRHSRTMAQINPSESLRICAFYSSATFKGRQTRACAVSLELCSSISVQGIP
jgi:glycosyltransferase involved in cell wall biosynthesis